MSEKERQTFWQLRKDGVGWGRANFEPVTRNQIFAPESLRYWKATVFLAGHKNAINKHSGLRGWPTGSRIPWRLFLVLSVPGNWWLQSGHPENSAMLEGAPQPRYMPRPLGTKICLHCSVSTCLIFSYILWWWSRTQCRGWQKEGNISETEQI